MHGISGARYVGRFLLLYYTVQQANMYWELEGRFGLGGDMGVGGGDLGWAVR